MAEAYAKVWPRWHRGRVDDLLPYLRRAVVNEVYGRGRRRRSSGATPTRAGDRPRTGQFEARVGERDALAAALDRLPLRQRVVVVLRVVDDVSEQDAGRPARRAPRDGEVPPVPRPRHPAPPCWRTTMLDLEERIRAEVTRQSRRLRARPPTCPSASTPGCGPPERPAPRGRRHGGGRAGRGGRGRGPGRLGADRTDTAPADRPGATRPAPTTTAPAPTDHRPDRPRRTAPGRPSRGPTRRRCRPPPRTTTTLPPGPHDLDGPPGLHQQRHAAEPGRCRPHLRGRRARLRRRNASRW